MTPSGDDERPRSLLADCIEDPERGKRQLPAVVGLLEHEEPATRLAAAWTCCLVAETHPDTVEYLLDRLGDRLTAPEVSLELTHALDYLADRYPEAVAAALDPEPGRENASESAGPAMPRPGAFTRNHYYSRAGGRSGVGRLRYPDPAGRDDPRRTYTHGEPDEREVVENRAAIADDDAARSEDDEGDAERDGEPTTADGAADDRPEPGDGETGGLVRRTTDVSTVAVRSRFDQLHILAARQRSRYSEDYRALVGSGARERAIVLRLLEVPEEDARGDFESDARRVLDRWAGLDDHPHVVSLLDWDVEPRPWLATGVTDRSLEQIVPLDRDRALPLAVALADAVAHVHRNDVVHGGLDPANVAYPGDVLDDTSREPPLLNNVGLVGCYRRYCNPATVLDPRYAAPEYFDSRFGVVDAATDIYQLGAILFFLYAGRPPVGGSFGAVRDAVTSPTTPVPGDVAGNVPSAVDEIVAKATATRKLTRYETIEHLQADLRAVREGRTE